MMSCSIFFVVLSVASNTHLQPCREAALTMTCSLLATEPSSVDSVVSPFAIRAQPRSQGASFEETQSPNSETLSPPTTAQTQSGINKEAG